MQSNSVDDYSTVLSSLFQTSDDAIIMADMKNIISRYSFLSQCFPFAKFLCSAQAVPPSSLLYHTLETLGTDFIADGKDDMGYLTSMALPISRQHLLNPYTPSSVLSSALFHGHFTFPINSIDQLERLANLTEDAHVIVVVKFKSRSGLFSASSEAAALFKKCFTLGYPITGLAIDCDFTLNSSLLRQMLGFVNVLLRLARIKFNFSISDLYFCAQFLKSDENVPEWLETFHSIFNAQQPCNNLNVHFDVTNYIFVNSFKLWARVKEKQQFDGLSRLYTVSEGVFSLFGNLLSIEKDEEKPFITECSGLEWCAGRVSDKGTRRCFFTSKIIGPSGDSELDVVVNECQLPDLDPIVDWLMIDFGAVIPSGLSAAPSDPLLYVM